MASSSENITEVASEDDGEKLAPKTVKQENFDINMEDQENSNLLATKEPEDSDTIDKNLEEILLADCDAQEFGDSDDQDDSIHLRWDDDDLDDDDGHKGASGDVNPSMSLQEEVIKTIDEEEKLLDSDNGSIETKESTTDSPSDNSYIPPVGHNLNKPDMMLEIPTQDFIECSDDESDFSNKLEMSPDIDEDIDEAVAQTSEADNESTLGVQEDKTPSSKDLVDNLENEAKVAADFLTKELNAMATETDTPMDNIEISNEEELLFEKDDMIVDGEIEVPNETVEQHAVAENLDIDDAIICESDDSEGNTKDIVMSEINEEKLLYSPPCDNETMNVSGDTTNEVQTVGAEGSDMSVTNFDVTDENEISLVEPMCNLVPTCEVTEPEKHKIAQNDTDTSKVNEPSLSLNINNDLFEPISDLKPNENVVTSLVSKTLAVINTMEGIAYLKDNDPELVKNCEQLVKENAVTEPELTEKNSNNKSTDEGDSLKQDTTVDLNLPAQSMDINEPQPSTSSADLQLKDLTSNQLLKSTEPTFGSSLDISKDVPEIGDNLDLLAETSRMMDEDEEQEDYDEGDDDDDFDPDDESSNQMTAEHSEDSNAQHWESEVKDLDTPTDKDPFEFPTTSVSTTIVKIEVMECDITDSKELEDELQTRTCESEEKDATKEQGSKDAMEVETVKISDSDNEIEETQKIKEEPESDEAVKKSTEKTDDSEMVIIDLVDNCLEDDSEYKKPEPQPDKSQELVTIKKYENDNEETVKLKESPSVTSKPDTTNNNATTGYSQNNKPKMSLEVFSLDSDEEEEKPNEKPPEVETANETKPDVKCINNSCRSAANTVYYIAENDAQNYFDADKKKLGYICQECLDVVEKRNQELISGVRDFTPLLQLGLTKIKDELVEISDSESEEEPEPDRSELELIGEEDARVAEEKLADMFNETWVKYKMDDRLKETETDLQMQMEKLQKESQEIEAMFNECQSATDKLRNELYATFEPDIRTLPPFVIYDMPNCSYSCTEPTEQIITKKRRAVPQVIPAKRPAIPMGYTPLDDKSGQNQKPNTSISNEKQEDDNMEISVVKLSAESAPKDLPPPGEVVLTPIKVGMVVYAMKNAYGSWLKARVVEILPKASNNFTNCRVKFEHKVSKNPFKILPGRCLAYCDPADVRMTIGRRVIALSRNNNKQEAFYSGIVAEIPNPVNSYRYLIFFDDGYAQYATHVQTRLVCECSSLVWEEVHPYSRKFVKQYLFAYPERPMVRLHEGQSLKTEWRGKWWSSRVVRVDASLVEVAFLRHERREWIYRGSTRLAPLYLELEAAGRQRPRAVRRAQPVAGTNMPYVEYTRSDEQPAKATESPPQSEQQQQLHQNEEMRRQRAVAKKSTTTSAPAPSQPASANEGATSRVVYYTPKNAVKPHKMVPHTCSPHCKRSDVLALKDLRTYNPLAKPLLSGWERQIVRWKGQRSVLYVAPCGRRVRDMKELHRYLRAVNSDMAVDLFDFSTATHCLAEFVLTKHYVGKKDLSHGKENVPVPCVNYYDESLPEFCSYNTERTPTAGVPLNLDPDFLCGCDCEDDCEDKTKCACWKLTLEGARTIGLKGNNVGYAYKRLPDPLPSGIYECNSRCKCKHTCLNRVAQHPLQLKLQVFKTQNRGWGIRALNDVPKGAFLCVYAGNLLTDATANLDGLNEGDEYLAELDYIEVVEQMKEGFEEDIPERIKKLDQKESEAQSSDAESSEEEVHNDKTDEQDDDFEPGHIGIGVTEFSKHLRRRDDRKRKEEAAKKESNDKEGNPDEDFITISDDEEAREPSFFTAAAGMGANEFVSKYRSVRTLFGEDEACYIMDAKVQGNIGRYLNHSCAPNVFVQNVFVDTHDPRFPWVAFFALSHIRAGTELTWNYNYDVGSVPGKVLYCYCGAVNCRGRLL